MQSYIKWDHALVDVVGSRMLGIDKELERNGLNRRIFLKIPHFLAALLIVANSDMIVTLPERIAKLFADFSHLTIIKPPIDQGDFPFVQVWHERSDNDPLHQWLRALIKKHTAML